MKENHSIKAIAERLSAAESVMLFPHMQIDGDAMGSCAALCKALRGAGKEAVILIEEELPEYLRFLDHGYCTMEPERIARPDVCMCVDCGETGRFPKGEKKFFQGKTTICLDHHATSAPFADYNFIDGSAAATAELVYQVILAMGLEIDKEIGEAIFAGISTDTGNFQYSNTTRQSHLITAALYDAGIDHAGVAVQLYQNTRLEKIRAANRILDTLELLADGKAAIAHVSREMLRQTGAELSETDGVVETLRNIKGVEIGAFLKEQDADRIKVSMRAKTTGNVARIAEMFGGGGHVKAAGCTLRMDLSQARETMKEAIETSLKAED